MAIESFEKSTSIFCQNNKNEKVNLQDTIQLKLYRIMKKNTCIINKFVHNVSRPHTKLTHFS